MSNSQPTTELHAAIFVKRAAEHLKERPSLTHNRDYHDRKAAQLLDRLHDLLIATAFIEAWFSDLGSNGECQVE